MRAESISYELNARGMRCPMPVLRLRRKLAEMQSGDTILIYFDDPNAAKDIPAFCVESGHSLIEIDEKLGCATVAKT
ncbi:sulfurtransferase TusA family protein [Temperatibacter marinus]|uniref:Sulfurtransferase TusA family protein n=1 Tax=Temperatibacter marinus TaxID=1456591 RepID=A0AA52HBN9_9PROT|nr:sulfurtransferase TusA family protein [Temperatibacter marinus]WND03950.1 sulfurtransferase TusA family protein [Temperatibacter marinus]